jgi:RNA polymerase sigma factor (sigma-70 family)
MSTSTFTSPAELDDAYDKTFARLSRIFRSRGLTLDDSEDLAQEAVLRTLTHLERHGRAADDLRPLMNTIAKNLVFERFRTGGRELPFAPDERLEGDAIDPADEVSRNEYKALVDAAIAELPERQRRAVRMWLDGARPTEIARALSLKRNAADALLHRARRFLATRLQDCRESLWSAGALVMSRVRSSATRAAAWSASFDPSCVAPAILGLTTLMVISTTTLDARGSSNVGNRSTPITHRTTDVSARTPRSSPPSELARPHRPRAGSPGEWRPLDYDVRRPRVDASTPPIKRASGEEEPIWISIWTDDEDEAGPVESALLDMTEHACNEVPSICEEEPR